MILCVDDDDDMKNESQGYPRSEAATPCLWLDKNPWMRNHERPPAARTTGWPSQCSVEWSDDQARHGQ